MMSCDWTLPEPNVSLYTDEMMNNAKEFSNTAMVVISRVGGEGADLPTDMAAVADGTYKADIPMTYDDSVNEGKTGTKEIISYSYQTEKKKCLILYVKTLTT